MNSDTGSHITRFKVGHGLAIVFPPTYVLVDPTNGAFAEKLWSVLEADGGVDELLETFLAEGLKSLGDFAMAQIEDEGLRVVVRGRARALVSTDSDTFPLEACTVKTWVEAVYGPSPGFALSIGEPTDDVLTYRFARGVVPADEIHWGDLNAGAVKLEGIEQDWVDAFEPIPTGPAPVPTPPEPQPAAATSAVAVSPTAVEEPVDDYDYDALYGATVAKSVVGAAVSSEPEEGEGQPADTPAVSTPPEPAPPRATSEETLAPPGDESDSGLIDSIPGRGGPLPASSPAPASGDQLGDHDGRTVSKARLAELRGQQPQQGAAPNPHTSGPMVQAVMCPQGHPNPTSSTTCSQCQQRLGTVAATIPRPVLGALVFSNGMRVELDRPAVIGRNPKLTGGMLNDMPQMVRLEGYEAISRTHAMIRIESWHVLVEDLESKFGTMLTLPGQEPRRLSKGEPAILEPGAIIDFAEEVTATYYGNG